MCLNFISGTCSGYPQGGFEPDSAAPLPDENYSDNPDLTTDLTDVTNKNSPPVANNPLCHFPPFSLLCGVFDRIVPHG